MTLRFIIFCVALCAIITMRKKNNKRLNVNHSTGSSSWIKRLEKNSLKVLSLYDEKKQKKVTTTKNLRSQTETMIKWNWNESFLRDFVITNTVCDRILMTENFNSVSTHHGHETWWRRRKEKYFYCHISSTQRLLKCDSGIWKMSCDL